MSVILETRWKGENSNRIQGKYMYEKDLRLYIYLPRIVESKKSKKTKEQKAKFIILLLLYNAK